MKVNYKLIYSYVRDCLDFPRMYFMNEDCEDQSSLFYLVFKHDKTYLDDVVKIKNLLKPYEKDIHSFYVDDEQGSYDFSALIERAYEMHESSSLDSFYQMILNENESVIKEKLLRAILLNDEDFQQLSNVQITKKALDFLNDQNEMIAYLKGIYLDEDYRWQLLMHLNKPLQAVEMHQKLIYSIKPLFDHYYQQKINEIDEVKVLLTDTLNEGIPAFLSLTNHMIPKTYLLDETNIIYISISSPYQITIRDSKKQPSITWGSRMAQGFKFLQKLHDNEIEKNVQIFKILSDKTRYQALCLIASGETSTKKIAELLEVSSATVSYHINAFLTFDIIVLSAEKSKKYDVNRKYLDTIWESFISDLEIGRKNQ